MKILLSSILSAVFILIMLASANAAPTAVPDPERNSTKPTGWHWWRNRTEAQINDMRNNGERLIDIERSPQDPDHYDVVLVKNKGVYERTEGWWYGQTQAQVEKKIRKKNGRLIDLEPYTVGGQRVFDIVLIRNEGDADKGWWWNYDLTPAQITDEINLHNVRLIDLDSYVVNGRLRYSYIGIKYEGVDKVAWWWYPEASVEFVTERINREGARLIDIEVNPNGTLAVILVKNDGSAWWWDNDASQAGMEERVCTTGSRLIDIESFYKEDKRRFAFVTIDNLKNDESRRLRSLLFSAYNDPLFGDKVIRGFLVKRTGGKTLAELGANCRFQPLSTLKLLPYLYALVELDNGDASLQDTVSWIETTVDDPNTTIDERRYTSCLKSSDPNTQVGSAKLKHALPTMMWESHGRTLDALLDDYGPTNITQRAQNDWGMPNTEMHFGCPQPGDPVPWAKNCTTLHELAAMFAGVENLQIVKNASTRQHFFDLMINIDYDGASYSSPITGQTTGPFYNGGLKSIVQEEAGPAKQGIVDDFLSHAVIRGKGGSGGPSSTEFGYSDFLHVTVPFKENGNIVLKTYEVGWFIYKLQAPPGCPKDDGSDSAACKAIWQPAIDAREHFRKELYRAPIREAIATW